MCREDEAHGQGVRPEDPQQVGDAEEGGDCVLPGGARRPRLWRPAVDHKPSLRFPRQHKLGELKSQTPAPIFNHKSFPHQKMSKLAQLRISPCVMCRRRPLEPISDCILICEGKKARASIV